MTSPPSPDPTLPGVDSPRSPLLGLLVPGVVLLVTLAVYLPALRGELVYDDLLLIGRNQLITDLANLPRILVRPYWDFLEPDEALQIGYWRPLTGVAHAVSYWIGGGAVWAFHAMGIGVHLLATLAAWSLARRLSGNLWVAGGTALVFGLHPTHVESVAWISALNDPLFGLFALLALGLHLRWRDRGSRGIPLVAALCFLGALGAKELGAAVLPMVAAIDLGRRRREGEPRGFLGSFHAAGRAYAPYGIVLALYLVARMFVFHSPWAGFDRVTTDFGVGALRLATLRVELLGGALELLAWPQHLRLFRPFRPELALGSADLVRAFLWLAIAAGLGVLLWIRRGRPGLAALLLIPAGFLPVLVRVESLGSFPLSDRFLYVPVFGFGLGLSLVLFRYVPKVPAALALVVIAGLYGAKSHARIGTWHDEEVLFTTAAKETPGCPYVLWGLGRVVLDDVREREDLESLERAIEIYEYAGSQLVKAQEPGSDLFVSSRDFLQVNLGLGWCYVTEAQLQGSKDFSTAMTVFDRVAKRIEGIMERTAALRERGVPVIDEHLELEQVYYAMGYAHLHAGEYEEAERRLRMALSLRRNFPQANHALGILYLEQRQFLVARRYFEASLAQIPNNYEDLYRIALSYFEEGRTREAKERAEELTIRYPDRADPLVILAAIALQLRDWREALHWVDLALAAEPNHGYAWYHKANALVMRDAASTHPGQGMGAEVLEAYRTAAMLLPGNFEAQYQYAAYLLQAGARDAALPALVRAYELCEDPALLLPMRQELARQPDPTADYLYTLGRIDGRRGELALAESWLDAALSIDPDHVGSLFQKARVLRDRGRHEEAVPLMDKACRLQDRSYDLHSEFGLYLAELGDVEEALRHLERALEIGPPPQMGEALRQSGRRALQKKIDELIAERDMVGPPIRRD